MLNSQKEPEISEQKEQELKLSLRRHNLYHSYSAQHLKTLYDWSKKLHWIKISLDGYPELYLDNHMLQTFRMCESRFALEFIEGWAPKSAHMWFLDFGICTHTMIEYYYLHRKDTGFDIFEWATTKASELWEKMRMDELYKPGTPWHHENYTKLGGLTGFCTLLMQYTQTFHLDNERFRVIGAELYFGKEKEVPLVDSADDPAYAGFRLYLAGKIDLLVDDGYNIGPMDHKTTSGAASYAVRSYEIHEGMIGYIYATKALLRKGVESTWDSGRNCNKIWMNFLQVTPLPEKKRDGRKPEISERFARLPIFATDFQLEEYRLRQVSTASRILQLLLSDNLRPTRNTMACTNYMHRTCVYSEVHRQNSRDSELVQLNSSFEKKPIWDPENRNNDNLNEE